METSCIEWKGRKNTTGYGVILINGKQQFAHRLAVALSGRNIPKGKVCDHLCRNHACYNADHIELVTPGENSLRGEGVAARNARSNSCMRRHLYTPENTRLYADKKGRKTRHCRACFAARWRRNKHNSTSHKTQKQRNRLKKMSRANPDCECHTKKAV